MHVGLALPLVGLALPLVVFFFASILQKYTYRTGFQLLPIVCNSSFRFRRIAGLSERKAEEIVTWRQRNGSFRSREQLKEVNGIGEKTFQQCAGFLRIYQPPSESIILDTDDDEPVKGEKEKVTGKRKAEESGGKRNKKRKNTPSLTAFNKLDSTSIHPESYAIAEK